MVVSACWTSSTISELRVVCAIHLDVVQSDWDGSGDRLLRGTKSNLRAGFLASRCHNVSTWELSLPLSDKGSADSLTTPVLITSC